MAITIHNIYTVAGAGTVGANGDYKFYGGYAGDVPTFRKIGDLNYQIQAGSPHCFLSHDTSESSFDTLYTNDNAEPDLGTWSNSTPNTGASPAPTVTLKTSSGVPQGGLVLASFL